MFVELRMKPAPFEWVYDGLAPFRLPDVVASRQVRWLRCGRGLLDDTVTVHLLLRAQGGGPPLP